MRSIIFEFLKFIFIRKKIWLFPLVFFLLLFGLLIILTEGTAVAPFIYTIF